MSRYLLSTSFQAYTHTTLLDVGWTLLDAGEHCVVREQCDHHKTTYTHRAFLVGTSLENHDTLTVPTTVGVWATGTGFRCSWEFHTSTCLLLETLRACYTDASCTYIRTHVRSRQHWHLRRHWKTTAGSFNIRGNAMLSKCARTHTRTHGRTV